MRPTEPRRILAEGRYARLVAKDGWEWAERVNAWAAAVIVAITRDDHLILVEQHRIPLGCHVIELPAGLVGDGAGDADEGLVEAAQRELMEETGYEADSWKLLFEGPSSAGLSTEVFSLFLARNAQRVGLGGGDDSEDIQVHLVPLDKICDWLESKRQLGMMIDPKIYVGLYFASREGSAIA
jgi:ADP-ribose pyrophosphatase